MEETMKLGRIEFEAKVGGDVTVRGLEGLRRQLGADLQVRVMGDEAILVVAIERPESAVEEVELIDRVETLLRLSGCFEIGQAALWLDAEPGCVR